MTNSNIADYERQVVKDLGPEYSPEKIAKILGYLRYELETRSMTKDEFRYELNQALKAHVTSHQLMEVKTDLIKEITGVKTDFQKEITGVKTDLIKEVAEVRTELRSDRKLIRWMLGVISVVTVIPFLNEIAHWASHLI